MLVAAAPLLQFVTAAIDNACGAGEQGESGDQSGFVGCSAPDVVVAATLEEEE